MAIVTKTINPLHFEDLEPHRFEDLIRQLFYDYKEWRSLEATGRQGSDDGFDVRGREISNIGNVLTDGEEIEDRLWLIQCKREKSIPPKRLETYLNDLNKSNVSELYGLIFVAACDFSKKTRDRYRKWCIENNIREFHIFGKAELEDMLFQPKYDHLLFAYFDISIQIRKRSIKTQLQSMLATKRQAINHLDKYLRSCPDYRAIEVPDTGCPMLLRDPEANEYPYGDKIDSSNKPLTYHFIGYYHAGLKFVISSHFAYSDNEGNWDYDENISNYRLGVRNDILTKGEVSESENKAEHWV